MYNPSYNYIWFSIPFTSYNLRSFHIFCITLQDFYCMLYLLILLWSVVHICTIGTGCPANLHFPYVDIGLPGGMHSCGQRES